MRHQLDEDQIRFYRENGYLVIEDFLTSEELERWRAAVQKALERRKSVKIPGGHLQDTGSYYETVFQQRINLWMDNPAVRDLVLDWRLGKMAAQLEDVPAVRLWHDQALVKQPWANPTAFHRDGPYWAFTSPRTTTMWLALDDVDLRNGCLFFVPGSHRLETLNNVPIGPDLGAIFRANPGLPEPVPAPMRAGSCSFHNGWLVHGANANLTPRPRRAFTCIFMPDGTTFNGEPNILSPEQLRQLKVGDPFRDDRFNPLLYSRPQQEED